MRLKIENLAKIKSADILIDGITVIAGENNTGKSTVGKTLYATFNSMYNMEGEIEAEKYKEINRACRDFIASLLPNDKRRRASSVSRGVSTAIFDKIILSDSGVKNREAIADIITKEFKKYDGLDWTDIHDDDENLEILVSKIMDLKTGDDYKVSLELVSRFFRNVFESQIMCLSSKASEASVQLQIKNQSMELRFANNDCISLKADFNILHEAFFIDDPFVLDNDSGYLFQGASMKGIREQLELLLRQNTSLTEGIFDAVSAKESLKEIYAILNDVANGNILNKNGELELQSDQLAEPLHIDNLSAGLKSFVIIKLLLEKGILKEKDVLILDEPEIHLHPDWQLKYAEIIVLLQKKFDLSIVVTTHSRDFLEAIELYSKKHGIEAKCNYYISKENNGDVSFERVTGELDKIYAQMVTASMLLDRLRYSMVDEDE